MKKIFVFLFSVLLFIMLLYLSYLSYYIFLNITIDLSYCIYIIYIRKAKGFLVYSFNIIIRIL